MPYSFINASRNGRAMIDYILKEESHTEGKDRNVLLASIGFLSSPPYSIYEQWDWYRKRASAKNKNEARQLIISFSKNELPPEDPESYDTALQIMYDIAERAYPGHPFLMAVQNDGEGGLVHGHMISPNCSLAGLGFTDEQTKHYYLRRNVDEICSEYFELDSGRNSPERVTRSERGKRIRNEEIERQNQEIRKKNDIIRERNANLPEYEQEELLKEKSLIYIWKDDLKERIRNSMENATSREQFLEELTRHGVEGDYRHTKKNGDYIVYELIDLSKFEGDVPNKNAYFKCKSYKLGTDFDLKTLDECIHKNQEVQKTAEEEIQSPVTGDKIDTPDVRSAGPNLHEGVPDDEVSPVVLYRRQRKRAIEKAAAARAAEYDKARESAEAARAAQELREKEAAAKRRQQEMIEALSKDFDSRQKDSDTYLPDEWDRIIRRR